MNNYLSVTYSYERRPHSNYPNELAKYLYKQHNLNNYKNLIEFGCGRGDILKAFKKFNLNVTGLDVSEEAKTINNDLDIIIAKADDKNFNIEKKFDVIFSKSLIEHLEDPLQFLINCKKILNKNGLIITLTPSWFHHNFGPFYLDYTHRVPFTLHSLRDLGFYAGFQNVEVEYFHQLPFTWKYSYLKFIPKIIRLLKIPYFPMYEKMFPNIWPENLNKLVRFSREVMLISIIKT